MSQHDAHTQMRALKCSSGHAVWICGLLLVISSTGHAQTQSLPRPNIQPDDAAWLDRAMQAWALSEREILQITRSDDRVEFVFFDSQCAYRGTGEVGTLCDPHSNSVRLPDGKSVPAQVTSFAAPFDDNKRVFMAMALPGIWRAAGVHSELGLTTLMTAVFIHEMAHTRHLGTFVAKIESMASRFGPDAKINDDIVQERFGKDTRFAASIDTERELLFDSADSSDLDELRGGARQALSIINARRNSHYVGEHAVLRELEDIFLTMEGVAQWTAFQWLIHPRGAALDRQTALHELRRGGRKWSQDEGLAMFLVIDRLDPNWKKRVFTTDPPTALQLLAQATR